MTCFALKLNRIKLLGNPALVSRQIPVL